MRPWIGDHGRWKEVAARSNRMVQTPSDPGKLDATTPLWLSPGPTSVCEDLWAWVLHHAGAGSGGVGGALLEAK